jgi:hypothetical protein
MSAAAGTYASKGTVMTQPSDRFCPMSVTLLGGLGLLAFGLAVGAYGTLIGVGGAIFIVPVLLLVFHATPAQAAGTSLAVVFLNSATGALLYARQRKVDFRAGIWFAAATFPGAIAGAYLSKYFTGRTFEVSFAVLLLAIAAIVYRRPAEHVDPTVRQPYQLWIGLVVSFVVGFISSAMGIGGGIFHVPAMIHLMSFPTPIAVATSTFILAFSTLVGAATHISLGHVLLLPAALMGVGAVAGARVGATFAKRARSALIVRLLSLTLVVVAIRLLVR